MKKKMTVYIITIISLSVLLSISCSTASKIPPQRVYKPITGSILLDNSIILKKAIAINIQLLDVTIPTDDAIQLSKQIIKNPKKIPVNFSMRFDEHDIKSYGSYIIRLSVYEGETKIYKSTHDIAVLTKGNPDIIEIPVEQVY